MGTTFASRQQKLNQALTAITEENFDLAKSLFPQIFNGVNGGKQADPGMAGSLLVPYGHGYKNGV